ncbi:ATP-binding protein [Rhodospirillaceae bacterium SYSU D60014]|uniref:ATP-binding protein n=1 Tax=Virgifigura deserti TaxID=2268457 RepID=UPI000E667425
MQRALDPFFTTKADTGTGLGLSQVYGFVRQVGGDLQIESRVGTGTSVHLFFPRAAGKNTQPKRAMAKS